MSAAHTPNRPARLVARNFTVVGGQKNAAVKHTNGSYRLLRCVESPEP